MLDLDKEAPVKDELPGRPPMPAMLQTLTLQPFLTQPFDSVRRIAYEIGGRRAVDNTRREIEATRITMARVEALARRVPPTSGESSPDVRRSA